MFFLCLNIHFSGFCYFNNVAVAAKRALHTGRVQRVFILDWDVHHGNGIQDLTYDDPQIFYASIHRGPGRKEKNWFYPGTGYPTEVGTGVGAGTNMNILWGQGGMTNVEYAAAFTEAILPALQGYQPDLILIACGLDAAKGDLLGDCGLTPDMYYTMTQSLLDVAGVNIPIVAALEGGCSLDVCAACMEQVALALLDEPSDFMTNKNNTLKSLICQSLTVPRILPQPIGGSQNLFYAGGSTLNKHWDPDMWDGTLGAISKKATRTALLSIKRAKKALNRMGVSLHDSRAFDGILAAAIEKTSVAILPNDKSKQPNDGGHGSAPINQIDSRRPLKKRKNRL